MTNSVLTHKGKRSQEKIKQVSEIGEPHVSYIADFISGEEVKATPEEIEAVQSFHETIIRRLWLSEEPYTNASTISGKSSTVRYKKRIPSRYRSFQKRGKERCRCLYYC